MNTRRWILWGVLLCGVGLGTSAWAQSAAKLAQQMKEAKDDKALLAARDALVKMGGDGATALDKTVLADASAPANVRVNAALGLAKLLEDSNGAFGTPELAKYTGDKNAGVRYVALKALINPTARYAKAQSVLADAAKDAALPIRQMAIKAIEEQKGNPRLLAEMIVNPKEERDVKEEAERAFEAITGKNFGFTIAMKRDPANPKSTVPVPDPDKEKAAIAGYEGWLKENK